jgi:ABC-type sugar transport system ATPase subunit
MQAAFEVADRLLVMRHGRLVGEYSPSTTSVSELVSLMLGATETHV